jgi:hypothetical protein
VLRDPARFIDTATYNDPERIPEGISRVFIGGRTVWQTAHRPVRRQAMCCASRYPEAKKDHASDRRRQITPAEMCGPDGFCRRGQLLRQALESDFVTHLTIFPAIC